MKRSLGARYLPLAAVVAVQLMIVGLAPSKQPVQEVSSAGGAVPGASFDQNIPGVDSAIPGVDPIPGTGGTTGGSTQTTVATGSGGGTTQTTVATGGGTGGGGTTQTTTAPSGSGGGGTATTAPPTTAGGGGGSSASTAHCVGDRQFNPAIDFYAPPCVPAFGGANGGATSRGVTETEIKIVQYYGAGDPAVNAILVAQGAFVEANEHDAYNKVVSKFINDNYELYGRKVVIEIFEGSCDTIPPDIACLRGEMQELVQSRQPFAVFWNSSVCSACFEELSKLKVINLGGWNFRDAFGQRWRPYHYDVTMSGTRIAQHAGALWCNQLAKNNAEYAREDRYKTQQRALGVLSTNDPDNQAAVEVDFKAEIAKCGEDYGSRKYFYEQDISTADQQRRAGVLAMRGSAADPNDDATSVMCFCDLVAPAFLYQEEDVQQYYPENIVVGAGFMDADQAAQAYIGSVGCPQGGQCAFDGAFGFRSTTKGEPAFTGPGHRVWTAGGGGELGSTPFETADLIWDYLNLIASSIQMSGPNLNPEAFEQGAFRLGARGDATHVLRQISPGNYSWGQDVDRVYWSSTKTSDYNNKRGTYVKLDQQRTATNGWANQKLVLPAAPR